MNGGLLLWVSLLVFGHSFGVLHGQDDGPLRIVSASEDMIVKEKEDLHIYCHSNKPYSVCSFTLPGGTTCSIKSGESEKTCGVDGKFNKTNPAFCGLDIQDVSSEWNGLFKCEIVVFEDGNAVTEEKEIDVVIAQPTDVEFVDLYGSVTVIVDKASTFTCTGQYGRPAGEFIWRLGEKDDKDAIFLTNPSPNVVAVDENGYYKVAQNFSYMPEPKHNARNLYCIYEQKDHNGHLLFSQNDHITLDVSYLSQPVADSGFPSVSVGEDFEVSFVFEAKPKPKVEDVVWKVKEGEGDDIELKARNPRDPSIFMDGKYTVHPIREESENKFRITFKVANVTEEDLGRSYEVEILNRKKHSNDPLLSRVHLFEINEPGPDSGSLGMITGIVIAILLILLLITLITLLVVTYKHKKWCFAPKDPSTKPGYDGDVERPLNDFNNDHTGGASIIKPRS